jgi:hypothetical protein
LLGRNSGYPKSQLSTSWPADYPICLLAIGGKAD